MSTHANVTVDIGQADRLGDREGPRKSAGGEFAGMAIDAATRTWPAWTRN